jgi:hypothetical protein
MEAVEVARGPDPDGAAQAAGATRATGPKGASWNWRDWACQVFRESFGPVGERWASDLGHSAAQPTVLTLRELPVFELAVQAKLLQAVPGRADALQELRSGDATAARVCHTAVQFRVAALGLSLGWQPRLEVRELRAPIDIVLGTGQGGQLMLEVCVVHIGDSTSEALDRNRALVSPETQLYAVGHDVSITGHLGREPTREEVERVPKKLRAAIDLVASDRRERRVAVGNAGFLTLSYGAGNEGLQISWSFDPRLDPRRVLSTLSEKAEQASRSGARWLWVNWADAHWQLAPWWGRPLADKAEEVKHLVVKGVGLTSALDGVVVTPGISIGSSGRRDETATLDDGTVVLRRCLHMAGVREAVVVPLSAQGKSQLRLVAGLLQAETEWLPWALRQLGLPGLHETTSL